MANTWVEFAIEDNPTNFVKGWSTHSNGSDQETAKVMVDVSAISDATTLAVTRIVAVSDSTSGVLTLEFENGSPDAQICTFVGTGVFDFDLRGTGGMPDPGAGTGDVILTTTSLSSDDVTIVIYCRKIKAAGS